MDIIAHGLWTNLAFRAAKQKQKKKIILWGVFFGIAPDIFSFGLDFVLRIGGLGKVLGFPVTVGSFQNGVPLVPEYVYVLYNITHSFFIFTAVFLLIWALRRGKAWLPLLGWGLHILIDIPLHEASFFPTPIFWPLSDFHISGISWGTPLFFFPSWGILILIYLWLFLKKKKGLSKKSP